MSQISPKKIVDIVLESREINATNGEILDKLIQLGVEPLSAPWLLEAVDNGYKFGVCAQATPENVDSDSTVGMEYVFDIAFGRGKAARHGPSPLILSAKYGLLVMLAVSVLSVAWYFAFVAR